MSSRKRPADLTQRYDETDLLGIKVSHSESLFKEGQDVILTLKDANVLDENEDVLENVNLVDHEKAVRNVENKINKATYNPFEEPEYDSFGRFQKKGLLSKYDEELNNLKKEAFRIGLDKSRRSEQFDEIRRTISKERGEVSLQVPKYKIASEYYTEEEIVSFKKPKKSKKSKKLNKIKVKDEPITAESLLELDTNLNDNDEDHGSRNKRNNELKSERKVAEVIEDDSLVDEAFEEHQKLLQNVIKKKLVQKTSSSSRSKETNSNHRSKRMKKSDDAEVKKERHINSDEEMNGTNEEDDEDDFVIPDEEIYGAAIEEDDLQRDLMKSLDKVRKMKQKERNEAEVNLEKISEQIQTLNEDEIKAESNRATVYNGDSGKEIVINSTAEFCRNLGDISNMKEEELFDEFERDLKEEQDEEAMEIDDDDDDYVNGIEEKHSHKERSRNKWNEVDFKSDQTKASERLENKAIILEEEPVVSNGLAGALQLAMKKGYLDKEIKKSNISVKTSSLEAKNYTIEEKFHDDKIGRRERYSGALTEFKEKPNYKPDVKLEYNDDSGRQLNPKEAFRVLSHKFHGKGPGKNKIDKRMKKLQQEAVSIYIFFKISNKKF